eukprot:7382289-Prymnesium_polylepis.1
MTSYRRTSSICWRSVRFLCRINSLTFSTDGIGSEWADATNAPLVVQSRPFSRAAKSPLFSCLRSMRRITPTRTSPACRAASPARYPR